MQVADNAVRLDIAPELGELQRVGEQMEQFAAAAALPQSTLFGLQLCLEEAVSNTIRHGGVPQGLRIGVAVWLEAGELVAEIVDPGLPFDPLAAATPRVPLSLADAEIGGQGIALMRRFCPNIAYDRRDGLNRLLLRFPLGRET